MGPCNRKTSAAEVPDRDQAEDSELRRVREQLFALAEVARAYRDEVLATVPTSGIAKRFAQLLKADDNLRDALAIVARMKRYN